jgi:uncharacterized membrane protein
MGVRMSKRPVNDSSRKKERDSEIQGIISAQTKITEALERLQFEDPNKVPTMGERISDTLVTFIGSWRFLLLQTFLLFSWVVVNVVGCLVFDKYPFILLNLILSSQAAFSFPLVLMAQKRIEARDRARAVDSYRTVLHLEELLKDLRLKLEKRTRNGKSE